MNHLIDAQTFSLKRNTFINKKLLPVEDIETASPVSEKPEISRWEYFYTTVADSPFVVNKKKSEYSKQFSSENMDFLGITQGLCIVGEVKSHNPFRDISNKNSLVASTDWYNWNSSEDIPSLNAPTTGGFILIKSEIQPGTYWKSITTPSSSDLYIKDAIDELTSILVTIKVDVDLTEEEDKFTENIVLWVTKYNLTALSIVEEYFKIKIITNDQMSTILTAIGKIKDSSTYYPRLQLLKEFLSDDSEVIRYGAITGISNMNAREALHKLKESLKIEDTPPLIGLLRTTIKYFENTLIT